MWSRIGLYYCLWLQIGGTLTKRGSRNDAQGARPTAEFYTIEPEDLRRFTRTGPCRARVRHGAPGGGVRGVAQEQPARVAVKFRLVDGLTYIARHRDGLSALHDDGCSVALNRKNASFAGHDERDAAWGCIESLVENLEVERRRAFTPILKQLSKPCPQTLSESRDAPAGPLTWFSPPRRPE